MCGEVFYSAMPSPRSLSEIFLLDNELHPCSEPPTPPPPGGTEWAGLKLGISLSPGQLGSEKIPSSLGSGKILTAGLVTNILLHISKWLFLPPPAESMRGLFSDIHCEN